MSMSSSCCGTKPIRAFTRSDSRMLSSPNTRAVPEVGGPKPSSTSSSVVFPAPFLPSTPITSPGSATAVISCSTSFEPNDLLTLSALTTASGILVLPVLVDERDDVFFVELELPGGEHELPDFGLELLAPLRPRRGFRHASGHGHRFAAVAHKNALELEKVIGLGDRHRVDGVLERKLPDRRQGRAGRKLTARDEAPHLIHQLTVDRCPRLRIQDEHRDVDARSPRHV